MRNGEDETSGLCYGVLYVSLRIWLMPVLGFWIMIEKPGEIYS